MPTEFSFRYRFHPAGQGMFASGTLVEEPATQDPFDWVLDCGSTNQSVLKPAVEDYRFHDLGDRELKLLCLTHFDKDHVSGLGDLLAGKHVGTVVMPYYTPMERLIIGSLPRSAPDDYFDFLANPIAYLLELTASIKTIILVGTPPPDTDLGNVVVERNPRPTPGGGNREKSPKSEWSFEAKELEALSSGSTLINEATRAFAESLETEIRTTPGSFPARVRRTSVAGWEFLFYHRPLPSENISALRMAISRILGPRRPRPGSNVQPPNITQALRRQGIREKIRKAYHMVIPRPEDINSTSLCVYSGPLPGGRQFTILIEGPARYRYRRYQFAPCPIEFRLPKCSILYTGDANLKRRPDRKELHDFLTKSRRRQISVFQVPHHGSRYNWAPGAELHFSQDWSVFCANDRLKRPGHPHNEVFADFLYRNPILVNAEDGWNWQGTVHFP